MALPETYGPEGVEGHPTPGTHIWGWCRVPELVWLGEQAASMRNIVEVGALHGRSAFALLTACKGPVYCIDPWNDEHDLCEASFMGNCGHFPNVRPVRGFSPAAGKQVRAKKVDMVYLDGDHSRDGITADIDYWLPRTRKLICGHDYVDGADAGYPDVKAVVDEVFGDRVVVPADTAFWAVWL
jgi:hypothetical protein